MFSLASAAKENIFFLSNNFFLSSISFFSPSRVLWRIFSFSSSLFNAFSFRWISLGYNQEEDEFMERGKIEKASVVSINVYWNIDEDSLSASWTRKRSGWKQTVRSRKLILLGNTIVDYTELIALNWRQRKDWFIALRRWRRALKSSLWLRRITSKLVKHGTFMLFLKE